MGLNRIGQFADSMRDCFRYIADGHRAASGGGGAASGLVGTSVKNDFEGPVPVILV